MTTHHSDHTDGDLSNGANDARAAERDILHARDELLRLVMHRAGIVVFDYDVIADRVLWSPENRTLLGTPMRMPVTRADLMDLIHPHDHARVTRAMTAALDPQGSEIFSEEFRIRRADTGQTRWVANRGQTFFEGTGDGRRAVRMMGILMDVADRKFREAHDQFLSELSAAWIPVRDVPTLVRVTADAIAQYLQVSLVTLADITPDASVANAKLTFTIAGPSADGTYAVGEYLTDEARADLVAGRPVIVNDVTTDPRTAFARERYLAFSVGATVIIPVINSKGLKATLRVGTPGARSWRTDEIQLLDDVVARLWLAVERAGMEDALRKSEERHELLLRLSDELRPLTEPIDMQGAAARLLGEHLQVNRVSYADIEGAEFIVRLVHPSGVGPFVGRGPISTFGAALVEECRRGNPVMVNDVRTDPRLTESERANLLASDITAFAGVMLMRGGQWVAAFGAHSATPRIWTRAEIELIRDVAERTWDAIQRARTETGLREREHRLRLALDASGGGSWTWDAHTNHVDWDERFRVQFGFTPEEPPTFEAWLACVHEEDRPQVLRLLDEILHTDTTDAWDNAYRIVRPDGTVFWIQSLGRADHDARGQITRISGLELNITERRRAEEAAREREHRLRLALEASAAGIWAWNARTNEIDWDDRTRAQFGFAPGEPVTFEKWISRVHEEDRPLLLGRHHDMLHASQDEWNLTFRSVRPDGTEAWIQGLGRARYDSEGRVIGIMGISLDITAHRRAEEAVRVSEHKLRLSLRAGQLGTWQYDLNKGVFVADEAGMAMHGFDPDETIETVERARWHVHPDDFPRIQRMFEGAIADGASHNFEYRVVLPSGETRWIASVWMSQHENASVFGVVQDITERKRVELDLRDLHREQERTLRLLLETAAQGILSVDAGGFIVMANAATEKMFGWASGELIGRSVEQLLPPALRDRHATHRAAYFVAPQPRPMGVGMDLRGQRKDGSTFPIEISLNHVATADGGHAIAFVTDISARKRAEEALHRSHAELEQRTLQLSRLASQLTLAEQHAREQFARTLHDGLQQLLFSAALRLDQLLKRGTMLPTGEAELLAHVRTDINEALSASRSLNTELFPPALHGAGLPAAVTWLAEWMQQKYGLVVLATVDPLANSDRKDVRALLFESVRELLFNVVKHASVNQAAVELTCGSDDMLRVTVTDPGIGFNPARLSNPENSQKSGFGLFSIRERLTLLGGQFKVESSPGLGTKFCLLAPRGSVPNSAGGRVPSDFAATGQAPDTTSSASPTNLLRILVVDDHPAVRQVLSDTVLGDWPEFQVVGEATNGLEAIAQARALRPDVILMDISMPEMDGVEATRHIHAEFPFIQIFGLSAHERTQNLHALETAGGAGYFIKGTDMEQLVDRLLSIRTAKTHFKHSAP